MRIIAGSLRGRRIAAPKGDTTRPTIDRVRESVFSTLTSLAGPDLGGGSALDAFAGSGALGLEALSRGARRAVFFERDRVALKTLRTNIEALGVSERAAAFAGDAFSLATRVPGAPFALILLDPPYTLDTGRVTSLLDSLAAGRCIADGALVSWEHATGVSIGWPEHFSVRATKRYGSTTVEIAEYDEESGGL